MKVAIHQMCSGIDPENNIRAMEMAIFAASREGAGFYFAPEMSILLDRIAKRSARHVSAQGDDQYLGKLQNIAKAAGIWINIGSLAVRSEKQPDKYANRSLVIDAAGRIVAGYDKIHLFDVQLDTGELWRESSTYEAGTEAVVADTPLGRMGLSICYDLRFPDLYSSLANAKAQILAIPAAFTVPTGKAHWHSLLRARAIESTAFVVAAAQSGAHEDGRETYGHSLVVDPWGEILLDMGEGEGLGFADIGLSRITEARSQVPVHLNRAEIGEAKLY